MYYSLDRIIEDIAVLTDDSLHSLEVPLCQLQGEIREGNIYVHLENVFVFDENETNRRRFRIAQKRNELFH